MSVSLPAPEVNSDPVQNAVITNNADVDTVYAACKWLTNQIKGGHLNKDKAQQHITPLTSIVSVLTESEPNTVTSVLANLENLTERWGRSRSSKGEPSNTKTLHTYKGKAGWLLKQYTDFCADPMKYDTRKLAGKGSRPKEDKPPKANGSPATDPYTPPEPVSSTRVSCSLGTGNATLLLSFPTQELTTAHISIIACQLATMVSEFNVKDAGVIASHLATRGQDFDPTRSISDQMFCRPPTLSDRLREAGEQTKAAVTAGT